MAESWQRFHPDAPFRILLADADQVDRVTDDPSILVPENLGLDPSEIRIRRAIYNPFEFATSLKADLLRFLLHDGARTVIFTDSDTYLYAQLDAFADLAVAMGVCLTPHVSRPAPADSRGAADDWALLKLGIYNTGLVAVSGSGMPFLDWWADRLRRDCLDAWPDGFYVEQRWVDLAPTYFAARIVEDPTLNVAFWNLHERQIKEVDGGYQVNGEPLRHFHFSNFDPEHPRALCGHIRDLQGRPFRMTVDAQPALEGLFGDYARRLLEAGHRRYRSAAYPFASAVTGHPLTWWDRLLLREATLAHEAGAAPPAPDPFATEQAQEFARFTGASIASLPLSGPARDRLWRAHLGTRSRRAVGARERVLTVTRRLAGPWLSIERHDVVKASAEVLYEYGRDSPTFPAGGPLAELGAAGWPSHEDAAGTPVQPLK